MYQKWHVYCTSNLWIKEQASLSRFSASCSLILGSLCIDWSKLICTSTEPLFYTYKHLSALQKSENTGITMKSNLNSVLKILTKWRQWAFTPELVLTLAFLPASPTPAIICWTDIYKTNYSCHKASISLFRWQKQNAASPPVSAEGPLCWRAGWRSPT